VQEQPAPKAPEPPATKTVRFLAAPGAAGSADIDLQVNDANGTPRFYQFKRETPVVVPVHVLEVVDNAVATVYEQRGNHMVSKQVKRFPYEVIKG
jgi:hypothetical protein